MLFEAVQFAFKCNHHGSPQETPLHILVINMQTLKHFGGKEKKKKKSDFTETFILFYFFPTYDEFFALPFLAAGYRDLVCFVQSRRDADGLLSHMHREEDYMYAASPPKLLFNRRLS